LLSLLALFVDSKFPDLEVLDLSGGHWECAHISEESKLARSSHDVSSVLVGGFLQVRLMSGYVTGG
jgi:hypothetical protein